jgi:hypothetical protein
VSNPLGLIDLWKQNKALVKTDINDLQIPGFARLATQIDPNSLSFLSLGPTTTPWTTPEGHQVLLPSEAGIKQIVEAFISDAKLQQENAVVVLVNGTNLPDEVSRAAEYLSYLGLPKNPSVASGPIAALGPTQIIDFSNKSYTAGRIAASLGIPTSRIRMAIDADAPLRQTNADIVVVVGADARIGAELSR